MKPRYRAMAILTDGWREWVVTIYSGYNSVEEAEAGISRFASHGYYIVRTWIEEE